MPLDKETLDAIQQAEDRAKDYTNTVAAGYKQGNSWWQRVRRERPLAVQNVLIFAYGPVVLLIGVAIGKYLK